MAKFKFSPQSQEQQEPEKKRQGIGNCEIYGCGRLGTIYTGSWNCRYHHGKSGESLARITHAIHMNEPLINWHEKLMNFTVVDFDLRDVHKRAPHGLYVNDGETLQQYRLRIEIEVEKVLKGHKNA